MLSCEYACWNDNKRRVAIKYFTKMPCFVIKIRNIGGLFRNNMYIVWNADNTFICKWNTARVNTILMCAACPYNSCFPWINIQCQFTLWTVYCKVDIIFRWVYFMYHFLFMENQKILCGSSCVIICKCLITSTCWCSCC